ncbi:MAG: hypothetical protein V3W34_17850 [Phycisphaerae bacterium]
MTSKWIAVSIAVLMAFGGAPWHATAQVITSGSPAENVANRGGRRPGLMVAAGIAQHRFGPEITRPADSDPEDRLAENLIITFLRNLFATLSGLIPFLPNLLADTGTTTPPATGGGGGGLDDIVMTEIAQDGGVVLVELLNRGPIETRIDGWRFADGTNVSPPLPVIELDRNATVVVQLGGETQNPLADLLLGFRVLSVTAGELALYDFSTVSGDSPPIEEARFMIDYLQWNDDDQERDPPLEEVAVRASLWSEIDFIQAPLANITFRLDSGAEGRTTTSSRDFLIRPFADNTLGVPESQLTTDTEVNENSGNGR